jgi:hypothetical protein
VLVLCTGVIFAADPNDDASVLSMASRAKTLVTKMMSVTLDNDPLADFIGQFSNRSNISVSIKKAPALSSAVVRFHSEKITIDDLYHHLFVPRGYAYTLTGFGVEVLPLDKLDSKSPRHLILLSARFPGVLKREYAIRKRLKEFRITAREDGKTLNEVLGVFAKRSGMTFALDPSIGEIKEKFKINANDGLLTDVLLETLDSAGLGTVVLHGAVFVTTAKKAKALEAKLNAFGELGKKSLAGFEGEYALDKLGELIKKTAGVELTITPHAKPIPDERFNITAGMKLSDLPARLDLQTGMRLVLVRDEKLSPFYILDSERPANKWAERITGMTDEPTEEDIERLEWERNKINEDIEKCNERDKELMDKMAALSARIELLKAAFQSARARLIASGAKHEERMKKSEEWRTKNRELIGSLERLGKTSRRNILLLQKLNERKLVLRRRGSYLKRKAEALKEGRLSLHDKVKIVLSEGVPIHRAILLKVDKDTLTYELMNKRRSLSRKDVKEVLVRYKGKDVSVDLDTLEFK